MLYVVIFIILLILITLLLLLKVKTVVEYKKNGFDDHIVLSFFTFRGIIKLKYEIPLIDLQKDGLRIKKVQELGKKEKDIKKDDKKFNFISMYETFKEGYAFYCENKEAICKASNYLKKKLITKEFRLDVAVGTGDSFYTAILGGALWAIAGILLSFLANNTKAFEKHLNIKSDFTEKKFNIDLYCIFSIKIVHIIVVSLIMLFHIKIKAPRSKLRSIHLR